MRKTYGVSTDIKSFVDLARSMGGGPHQCKVYAEGKRRSERGLAFDLQHLPLNLVSEAIRLVRALKMLPQLILPFCQLEQEKLVPLLKLVWDEISESAPYPGLCIDQCDGASSSGPSQQCSASQKTPVKVMSCIKNSFNKLLLHSV